MRIETEASINLREALANFHATLRPALALWSRRLELACLAAHAELTACAESTALALAADRTGALAIDLLRVHVVTLARAVDASALASKRVSPRDALARLAIMDLLEQLSDLEDSVLGETHEPSCLSA
jgi:hypothetical protein